MTASEINDFQVLVTAEEAYPAFEQAFLDAQHSILCSFRVFDLDTRLRSAAAGETGETWFDLLAHTLRRGVDVTMVLADFDPVVATDLHRQSWQSAQQLAALDEIAGTGSLKFRVAQHPAKAGVLPRMLFRHRVRRKFEKRRPDQYTPGLKDVSRNDLYELHPVTHHQKLAVFDRKRLYIGGIDLDERRFDTKAHARPAAETWADVQLLIDGPIAEAAARHIETFEEVVHGHRSPEPARAGFLRTLSAKRPLPFLRISPRPLLQEIEAAHLASVERAQHLVYLETQFFRHQPLADALVRAAKRAPDLRLILIVPAAPEEVAFDDYDGQDAQLGEGLQATAIDKLLDAFGPRIVVASPVQPRPARSGSRDTLGGSPIIYVHSKVSIFDRTSAIVSSANLNGRSFRWDTEAGVELTQGDHVVHLRNRMINHWFSDNLTGQYCDDDTALFEACRQRIVEAATARPEDRRTLLLPYDPGPARDMGTTTPLAPDEIV